MISFRELIDKAIQKENKREHISSGKWNPSSFGFCYRRQYLKRMGEKETNPPDARTLRVFKVGNIFESWVKGLLKDQPDMSYQVLVEDDDVKGYADFVNTTVVYDTKTMHSQGFHYLTKKDCDIREEKKNNWLQIMYYALKLGKQYGVLVFISKDDLCINEPKQPVDDYWKKEIETELTTLRGYWDKKELPPAKPRVYKQKDGSYKECEYCQFKDKCKELK